MISMFWPAHNPEFLEIVKSRDATVMAMDMVLRIRRAEKLDALSSMANIAGYRGGLELRVVLHRAGDGGGRLLNPRQLT